MSSNKLVIRRLPPSLSEDDFVKIISPLAEHNYFCFFEANSGLGPHSYSRAYINFINEADMSIFRDKFDNYIFKDKGGRDYHAVVEKSMWAKCPNKCPFFSSANQDCATSSPGSDQKKSIEEDEDFLEFIQAQRAKNSRK